MSDASVAGSLGQSPAGNDRPSELDPSASRAGQDDGGGSSSSGGGGGGGGGSNAPRVVDASLIRAHSAAHTLAHSLCERAHSTCAPAAAPDLPGEDGLLAALKFPLHAAMAVPVCTQVSSATGEAGATEACAVLVLFSDRHDQLQRKRGVMGPTLMAAWSLGVVVGRIAEALQRGDQPHCPPLASLRVSFADGFRGPSGQAEQLTAAGQLPSPAHSSGLTGSLAASGSRPGAGAQGQDGAPGAQGLVAPSSQASILTASDGLPPHSKHVEADSASPRGADAVAAAAASRRLARWAAFLVAVTGAESSRCFVFGRSPAVAGSEPMPVTLAATVGTNLSPAPAAAGVPAASHAEDANAGATSDAAATAATAAAAAGDVASAAAATALSSTVDETLPASADARLSALPLETARSLAASSVRPFPVQRWVDHAKFLPGPGAKPSTGGAKPGGSPPPFDGTSVAFPVLALGAPDRVPGLGSADRAGAAAVGATEAAGAHAVAVIVLTFDSPDAPTPPPASPLPAGVPSSSASAADAAASGVVPAATGASAVPGHFHSGWPADSPSSRSLLTLASLSLATLLQPEPAAGPSSHRQSVDITAPHRPSAPSPAVQGRFGARRALPLLPGQHSEAFTVLRALAGEHVAPLHCQDPESALVTTVSIVATSGDFLSTGVADALLHEAQRVSEAAVAPRGGAAGAQTADGAGNTASAVAARASAAAAAAASIGGHGADSASAGGMAAEGGAPTSLGFQLGTSGGLGAGSAVMRMLHGPGGANGSANPLLSTNSFGFGLASGNLHSLHGADDDDDGAGAGSGDEPGIAAHHHHHHHLHGHGHGHPHLHHHHGSGGGMHMGLLQGGAGGGGGGAGRGGGNGGGPVMGVGAGPTASRLLLAGEDVSMAAQSLASLASEDDPARSSSRGGGHSSAHGLLGRSLPAVTGPAYFRHGHGHGHGHGHEGASSGAMSSLHASLLQGHGGQSFGGNMAALVAGPHFAGGGSSSGFASHGVPASAGVGLSGVGLSQYGAPAGRAPGPLPDPFMGDHHSREDRAPKRRRSGGHAGEFDGMADMSAAAPASDPHGDSAGGAAGNRPRSRAREPAKTELATSGGLGRRTDRVGWGDELESRTAPSADKGGGGGGGGRRGSSYGVPLRKGKWPPEEAAYVELVKRTFEEGLLPLPEGVTLRAMLAVQLHCAPMRITKKFAGDTSLGKRMYRRNPDSLQPQEWKERSDERLRLIEDLRARLTDKLQRGSAPFVLDDVVENGIGSPAYMARLAPASAYAGVQLGAKLRLPPGYTRLVFRDAEEDASTGGAGVAEDFSPLRPAAAETALPPLHSDNQRAMAKGAAGTKTKRARKPGPKRAATAFFIFSGKQRAAIKADHPEWGVTDVSKELGRQWRELSDDEKIPYNELAAEDKARYAREKAEFDAKGSPAEDDEDADELPFVASIDTILRTVGLLPCSVLLPLKPPPPRPPVALGSMAPGVAVPKIPISQTSRPSEGDANNAAHLLLALSQQLPAAGSPVEAPSRGFEPLPSAGTYRSFPSQTSSETDGYQLRHVSSAEYGRRTVGADGAQGLGPLNTVGSVLSLGPRPSAHFGSLDRDSLAALKLPGNYGDSARHMTLQFRGSSRPFAYHDLGAPAYVQHHRRSESSGQFASINVPQPGQLRSTAAAARLAEAVWAPAADGSAAELGTRPGKRQRDDSEPLPSAQRLVRASAPWTAAAAAKTESAAVAPEDVSDASEEHDDDDTDGDFESMAKRRRPARSRAQSGGARRRRSSKDHACTYPGCTKVFKSNSDLAAHKRTHTGEKPLKCKYEGCDAAFAHSSNRRQHERSKHEKVKRYHCRFPGCKKEYAHPTSRNDHEAVKHRNERPYKCDRCGADFTARANLSRHKSGGDCKAPAATPALPSTTVGSEAKPQLSTS
ncbi:hypothetical protein FNF31_03248 [Cafeteria roenbergensis]|uniref:HMG box domain-containing protein n=2 Tax=Cafeteria roenbergensis TaxID=33653 RepID=A0A5A8DC08_CAFRO|nr:hypothetical protein FNF31_03248 [Cafeteria roenbergensis]